MPHLLLVIVLLLPISLSAAESTSVPAKPPLIFVYDSYLIEPYVFIHNGHITGGIYWELAQLIGAQLQQPIQFQRSPRRRMEQFLAEGRAHVLLLTNPAWMTAPEALSWTVRVSREKDVIVQAQGRRFDMHSLDNLLGKRLGTVQGYQYQGFAEEPYLSLIIRDDAKSIPTNFTRLLRARLDALIAPDIVVGYLFKEQYDPNAFHVVQTWSMEHDIFSAVSPKSPVSAEQLSDVYRKLHQERKLEEVFKKYR
ncbi:substrate-binding periplasmic protein [Simiduia aestuariiviva]|uniref:ABC-type amino acid transport substrate-binding protein n=1 Tax=Simiduia aestuariiviva TaxID=1510459 RepID=A0A839UKY2_9GAMM|nr:transporter substrate-binding domain-containing protein [Simiduia aestuariiviva]MBB3167239.1 ABC-type amino acid transport substrate-binding protein [Simiduia aestuariiviva]